MMKQGNQKEQAGTHTSSIILHWGHVVPAESHVQQIPDASMIAVGLQMDSQSGPSNAHVPVTTKGGE